MSRIERVLEQWRRERPDLDVAPMGMIGRLRRSSRYIGRAVERTIAAQGLTVANFDVLATLRRSGEPYRLSPGDLLANTMVTSGTMTHRIDQLVKAGYVRRTENPDDGRSVLIELLDPGFAVVEKAVTAHVETLATLTDGLTESEAKRLDRLLGKLLDTLAEQEGDL